MFSNRQQAGALLMRKTVDSLYSEPGINVGEIVILALPRGGVPVALELAFALGCPLDVLSSKKIGAPEQKELAVGAVTSSGVVVIDEILTSYLGISNEYIDKEKNYRVNKTRQLEERWRVSAGLQSKLSLNHKIVVVVDDGVATGMTAIAAARSLKKQNVSQMIFATPVISPYALSRLLPEYDQVIALETPSDFSSVGQFYLDFQQVEDLEVVHALTQAMNKSCVKLV